MPIQIGPLQWGSIQATPPPPPRPPARGRICRGRYASCGHAGLLSCLNANSTDSFPYFISDNVGTDGDHHVSPAQRGGGAGRSAP